MKRYELIDLWIVSHRKRYVVLMSLVYGSQVNNYFSSIVWSCKTIGAHPFVNNLNKFNSIQGQCVARNQRFVIHKQIIYLRKETHTRKKKLFISRSFLFFSVSSILHVFWQAQGYSNKLKVSKLHYKVQSFNAFQIFVFYFQLTGASLQNFSFSNSFAHFY